MTARAQSLKRRLTSQVGGDVWREKGAQMRTVSGSSDANEPNLTSCEQR